MLKYLARYVFKTAITDSRIVSTANRSVTFRYHKKGAHRDRRMTLSHDEFMRRYLQHVLPHGFMRIRYYGFMSPGAGIDHRRLTALVEMAQAFEVAALEHRPQPSKPLCCTRCGGPLKFQRRLRPQRSVPQAPLPAFQKLE